MVPVAVVSRIAGLLAVLFSSLASAQVVDVVSRNSGSVAADSFSYDPSPSHDARYVAFGSWAHNLVSDLQVTHPSIYLRDTVARTTMLVTQAAGAAADGDSYLPAISSDGGTVVFWSKAFEPRPRRHEQRRGSVRVGPSDRHPDPGGPFRYRAAAAAGDRESLRRLPTLGER